MLSFLSVQVGADWNLSTAQQSSLISCVFAGAFVGTLFLGRLGDLWGRQPVFMLTAGLVSLGGLSSALSQHYWQLVLCRAVVGMGVGGVTIPFDTYAEILPTSRRRGKARALPSYFWTTGTVLVVLGAHMTTPHWRWLCVWCIVPAVVVDGKQSSSSDEEQDEECFAGVILEERENYVRIRFDGMNKKEDMWLPIDSPKLFLDGGRWGEDVKHDLPNLHFWSVEDSKRRCV